MRTREEIENEVFNPSERILLPQIREVLLDIRDLLGVMERKVDYIVEETD